MAKCSDKKNPLQRNGTDRKERLLPGMKSDYVKVDEKTFADWIVFAKEYAAYLDYYELTGEKGGNWSSFFNSDVSAILGTLAIQDVDAYKRMVKERFDFLKDDDHDNMLPAAKRQLNDLFSILLTYCEALDEFYRLLPVDIQFKKTIENVIKINLAPSFQRLLGYYKAANPGLLKTGDFINLKVFGIQVKEAKLIIKDIGISNLWWINKKAPAVPYATWKDYFDDIPPDASVFGLNAWDDFKRIYHAANHNLFAGVFDQFLVGYSKLITGAEKELLQTLENRSTHPAHYALFLAFLKLFRAAQDDLNTISRRHLDFYYKDILQLKQRAALPNSAHLITELAKPVEDHLLAAGTIFKAGKDSEGKEVQYILGAETTFNKAKVKSLRSIYMGTEADNYLKVINDGRLFAAPMINSDDGVEAELTSVNKEWHPIVNRSYVDGEIVGIKIPGSAIGFAIASHYLYLQEGSRKVILRLVTSNPAALAGREFEISVTTEKEWYRITATASVTTDNSKLNLTEDCTEISFILGGDEPAITNYDPGVHGGTLNVRVPVVKLMLIQVENFPYDYESLREVTVSKLQVAVEVGMETTAFNQKGLKQLLVSTDGGPVDTSKPFQPFGGQPRKDTMLIIGNKELFTKKNTSIKLNVEWGGLPGSQYDINYNTTYSSSKQSDNTYTFSAVTSNTPYYPKVKSQFLVDGSWNSVNGDGSTMNAVDIFDGIDSTVQIFSAALKLNNKTVTDFFSEEYNYNANSVNGFMRLVLDGDFGHKKYLSDLTAYLIDKNKSIYYSRDVGVLPIEPYTPIIQSLYISYSAVSDVVDLTAGYDFKNKPVSFFHLYPFGDAEQHAFFNNAPALYLLPQFRHQLDDGKPVLHEGEFYIGIENLEAKQSVNILFQVMDGTADPTISKPDDHIQWSYLSNNEWKAFKSQEISDGTNQLIQSGIISFIIPADATTANTLMPASLLWIRAAIANKSDAICKLITVEAQAAHVTFQDNNNAGDFLNNALPANTISKLKVPQSAIKKINQPYSSFGGRPLESHDAFYVRVSERLRHKARAITIWDYEHLVLEAFPQIHKVKCLNHTKSVDEDYNEVLPGHVTIITIPDLQQRNDINPLKPYTSQAVLKAIEDYLKKRISCHVQLHVVNPVFEEIMIKFKLKLAKGYDDFTIYAKKLQEEITNFLSPWVNGGEINFGGRIVKSVLINFIEERPYVDFITDVELLLYAEIGTVKEKDYDEIVASMAKSILVSVPASKHVVEKFNEEVLVEPKECAYLDEVNKV